MSADDIERLLTEHDIELVRFETPDLNGVSRGKTVAVEHFRHFVDNGLALVSDIFAWDHECWVARGTGFAEALTFADLTMRPDLSTFAVLPHVGGQARVICDMEYADGRPVEASPRRVLQRHAASSRLGRAGINRGDLMARAGDLDQRRHGEIRGAHEDDAHAGSDP